MKKVYDYYKKYGLFGSMMKMYRKIHKKIITKYYKKFCKYKYKNVQLLKKKRVYFFCAKYNDNKNIITKNIAETLNNIGYDVCYIYTDKYKLPIRNLKVSKKIYLI